MNALCIRDLNFSYDGRRTILGAVSLDAAEGEAVAITGRSGCGKSTLAMIACGVIPKSIHGELSGSVRVFGEDIKYKDICDTARQISMVFQEPESQLFAPAVVDEAAFSPENLCFECAEIISSVESVLGAVGMTAFYDCPPHTLSSGQQQLVALASILSLDPRIIILDEVSAQTDEAGQALITDAVRLLKKRGKTLIIIDQGKALRGLCDTAYKLEQGKLHLI